MTFAGTSVTDFFSRFPTEDACLKHIFEVKFGDHSPCPSCGGVGGWFHIGGTKKFQHRCRKHISVLEGTPFYRSNLSLMAWFYAMLLLANSSTGVRSSFLRRQMGIGVKSAHRLCNALRTHMASFEQPEMLGGPGKYVHIDEAIIRNVADLRNGRSRIIMGMECDGKVRCGILKDRTLQSITAAISKLVRRDSILVTDCHLAYSSLASLGWEHISINHSRAFHNFAGITNNPIEAFWGVLKRCLRLYRQAGSDNLWCFLAEIQFRYNRRHAENSPFDELIGSFPRLSSEARAGLRENFEWERFSNC